MAFNHPFGNFLQAHRAEFFGDLPDNSKETNHDRKGTATKPSPSVSTADSRADAGETDRRCRQDGDSVRDESRLQQGDVCPDRKTTEGSRGSDR